MLSVHLVAPYGEWTSSRRDFVQSELIQPLAEKFARTEAQLSLRLIEDRSGFTLWAVLQTLDRRSNLVFRFLGSEPEPLLKAVEQQIAKRLQIAETKSFVGVRDWLVSHAPRNAFGFS